MLGVMGANLNENPEESGVLPMAWVLANVLERCSYMLVYIHIHTPVM